MEKSFFSYAGMLKLKRFDNVIYTKPKRNATAFENMYIRNYSNPPKLCEDTIKLVYKDYRSGLNRQVVFILTYNFKCYTRYDVTTL